MTYIETQEIRQLTVRTSKAHSSFFYFNLESNENLAFYSTLESSLGQLHRDIVVHCTPEFSKDIDNFISHLQKKIDIEILEDKVIKDL